LSEDNYSAQVLVEGAMYWVYENWTVWPKKALIHLAACSFSNDGKGLGGGTNARNSRWYGPFTFGAGGDGIGNIDKDV
jgi:hypothetical protein